MCTAALKRFCCSSRRKMRAREKRKHVEISLCAHTTTFLCTSGSWKISLLAPWASKCQRKSSYTFLPPLGQKVVLIRCSKHFSRSGARAFFYQPQLARAFGENNAEQRLVRGCHPGCVFSFMKSGHRWHFCDNNCHQPQNGSHSTLDASAPSANGPSAERDDGWRKHNGREHIISMVVDASGADHMRCCEFSLVHAETRVYMSGCGSNANHSR